MARFVLVTGVVAAIQPFVGTATQEDRGGAKRWLGSFAKLAVSLLAVAILARQVDLAGIRAVLAGVPSAFVAAVVALYLLGQCLTAYRWFVISTAVGFAHSASAVLRFYFIGMFFNLFGPSTLGGDAVRALYLGEATRRWAVALNTVIFDRLVGLAMLVAVAAVGLAGFGRFGLPWVLVGVTVAAGLTLAVAWWVVPAVVSRLLRPDHRLRRLVETDLAPFWEDRGLLVRTSAISVIFHVGQVASLILLGYGVGLDVDWRYYFVFHPLVSILSAVPISLAGIGIREMGYLWFLERQGVAPEVALGFGLLWFFVLIVASVVGGLVYLGSREPFPLGNRTKKS